MDTYISSHHLTPFLSTNWTSCTKTKTDTCTEWAFEYLLVVIVDILLGVGIGCLLLLFYVVVHVLDILLFVGICILFLLIFHHHNLLPLLNNLQHIPPITTITIKISQTHPIRHNNLKFLTPHNKPIPIRVHLKLQYTFF